MGVVVVGQKHVRGGCKRLEGGRRGQTAGKGRGDVCELIGAKGGAKGGAGGHS